MNSLSWLIYLSDVVGKVNTFFTAFAMFGILIAVVAYGVSSAAFASNDMCEETYAKMVGFCKKLVIAGLISGFVSTVIPSQNTVYLIAASQGAQTVVTNPEAQKIFKSTMDVINLELQKTAGDLAKSVSAKN